jgi:hypothetical protein
MTTKITAIIDNPASPDDFEADHSVLVTRARKMPGFQRMETTKVWPKEDGSPTPAYRPLGLYSSDSGSDSASRAVTTPEASDFFQRAFEMAAGGAGAPFADVEES